LFNEFLTAYGSRLINAATKVGASLGWFMSRFIVAYLFGAITEQSSYQAIL